MSMTDPISDMLTRIRNGSKARKIAVDIPASNSKREIARVMKEHLFIKDYMDIPDGKQGILRVYLKYSKQDDPIIKGLKRVSRPGLRKYFTIEGESFRLIPEIKELVTFSLYDMLEKKTYVPPESVFGSFDMVLCRNVLIYFNAEYQGIIFDKLYRSLARNAFLVLGKAEIPSIKYQRYFKRVTEYCHIYQKT